jgi:membrane-bound lytic murein transglycosylase B
MARLKPLCLLFAAAVFSGSSAEASPLRTMSEYSWLQQLEQQAVEDGVSPNVVHEALDNFSPNPRVVELDQKQPEATVAFETYRHNAVTPARVKKGAEALRLYEKELAAIEARTGVPPQIVIALWGSESSFGQNTGDFDVVNALATLVYVGRRADFFKSELFAALHILEREHMAADDLRGSWAGAMGQCQFMPSTYLKYAVDPSGKGRPDIWNDPVDALASIANYLAAEGWKRGMTWGHEVEDGGDRSQESFVQPDGEGSGGFLVTDNFRALTRWNHSTYFALSVGLLADAIKND